jgi:hypothetical protein
MAINSNAPAGAHCFIKGQYFKVGRFNRVFAHRGGEWVLTTGMTVEQIGREIIKQEADESLAYMKKAKKRYTL